MTTHLGANALADGEAGSAVSAAINLMFSPTITAAICQLQVRNRKLEFATGTAAVTNGLQGRTRIQLHMSWAACAVPSAGMTMLVRGQPKGLQSALCCPTNIRSMPIAGRPVARSGYILLCPATEDGAHALESVLAMTNHLRSCACTLRCQNAHLPPRSPRAIRYRRCIILCACPLEDNAEGLIESDSSPPQSLSPVGRCKTFEASADGYGRAEGAAAIVLAPTSDGVRAFGLLAGSAVNQDGRSGTLTAPNGPSQSALVSKALRCGLPRDFQPIVIHL